MIGCLSLVADLLGNVHVTAAMLFLTVNPSIIGSPGYGNAVIVAVTTIYQFYEIVSREYGSWPSQLE